MGVKCGKSTIRTVRCPESDIDVENVLPWATGDWPGFYFSQIDAGVSEPFQSSDEATGAVLNCEGDAHLVDQTAICRGWSRTAHHEVKTGEVGSVILDAGLEHRTSILLRCEGGSDPRSISQAVLHDVLDAAGGVVEGDNLELTMLIQEVPALGKSNGMRDDPADLTEGYSGKRNEIVLDVEEAFAVDANRLLEQQIVVLVDGAMEAVFDREYGAVNDTFDEAFEDFCGDATGHNLHGCPVEHAECGHVAVRAQLALNRNSHTQHEWLSNFSCIGNLRSDSGNLPKQGHLRPI
jgi:hypothetical protein